MSFGLSKVCLCGLTLWASSLPHAAEVSAPLWDNFNCTDAQVLNVEYNFYARQTRHSLEALAQDNHPVGLYYIARQAYNNQAHEEALRILEQAAVQGLPDAYKSMAEIYSLNGQGSSALKAMRCARVLETVKQNERS